MESNQEIIHNIREIYRTAPADKIHSLISKHFIPSQDEKQKNAEIPTPIILVDNMLDKDSHLSYEYYDLFKDPFFAFSKEIIDTFTILHSPTISSYVTSEINPIDKHILLSPKQKTVIEIMKKI